MADKQYEPTHPCWCRSRRAPRWVVPARLLRSHGFDCCVVSEKLSSSEWRNRLSAHIYEIIIGHLYFAVMRSLNDATAESKRYDQIPIAWHDMMGKGGQEVVQGHVTWYDTGTHSLTHSLTHLLTYLLTHSSSSLTYSLTYSLTH